MYTRSMKLSDLIRRIRIQKTIRQIVSVDSDRCRQFTLGLLFNMVRESVPEVAGHQEIVNSLKILWRSGQVFLTKPDYYRLHAIGYTGIESDDWFFYRFNFNVGFTEGSF